MLVSVKARVLPHVVMIVVKNVRMDARSHVLEARHPEIMEINNGGGYICQV